MTQRQEDRLRALLVVYSADPRSSASVPRVGHRIAAGFDELTDATYVFHARHRKDITGWFPDDRVIFAGSRRLAEGLQRIFHRLLPGRRGPITAIETLIIEILDYIVFDIDSYRKARRFIRKERVDFLLRVTPMSPRIASVLAHLPIPVFTGPHNGGMTWPVEFRYIDKKQQTAEGLRFLGDIMHKLYRDTGQYAGVFAAHELCAQTVDPAHRGKVIIIAENAVDKLGEPSPWSGDANRLLYVGRLVPFKAVDIILKAMVRLPATVRLTLVGEGTERPELEKLAFDLGVQDRCEFIGHKPHHELEKYYSTSGVFVFPSVRESGGMVVLEAMSHALPCLVANWGGPAIYTRNTGIQLSVDSPQALEDDLVRTLAKLLAVPAEGKRIGIASRDAVREEYIWDRKAELLLDAIRERIGSAQANRLDSHGQSDIGRVPRRNLTSRLPQIRA